MTLFGNLHTDLSVALGLAIAHLALTLIYLFASKVPQFLEPVSDGLLSVPLLGKNGLGIVGDIPIPVVGKAGLLGFLFEPQYYLYTSTIACAGMVAIVAMAIQDEKVKN